MTPPAAPPALPPRRALLRRLGSGVAWLAASGPVWPQAAKPSSDDKGPPLPRVGEPLALPALALFDGSRFEPKSAEGQVLVLYWWASWCPFCAMQSPLMEQLWRAQRGRGLKMLGLAVDKRADEAVAYHAKRGYTFPAGWVTPEAAATLPKPRGLPVTVVRGRDGRVLMAEGGQLFAEDIEDIARFL